MTMMDHPSLGKQVPGYFVSPSDPHHHTQHHTQSFNYNDPIGFSTDYSAALLSPAVGTCPNYPSHFHPSSEIVAADPYPIVSDPVAALAVPIPTSSSSRNQLNDTFDWLEDNFKFRQSVSISRSTIYELYRKFCQLNNYSPVCKATFGKIIRKKFSNVKSKRLGARGHSKYHYYNITFKDERNHCNRLQLFNSHHTNGTAGSSPVLSNQSPNLSTLSTGSILTNDHCFGSATGLFSHDPSSLVEPFNQSTSQHKLGPIRRLTTFSNRNLEDSAGSGASVLQTIGIGVSTTGCDNFATTESFNLSELNLNQNDYHDIIQSMLSYMKIPIDRHQPLNNEKHVFINLYKIHCQCLIDSALSGNYSQMRHYILHFWQQLPSNIVIYVQAMNSLDEFMYALLEGIYLMSDSGSVLAASDDNLKHLGTIAHLMPLWLDKTFQHLQEQSNLVLDQSTELAESPESFPNQQQQQWQLQFSSSSSSIFSSLTIGQIKVVEAFRWHCRIKFKIELLTMLKKIDFAMLPEVIDQLIELVSSFSKPGHFFSIESTLKNNFPDHLVDDPETQITHLHYRQFVLDHQFRQSKVSISYYGLVENFRQFLFRLRSNRTTIESEQSIQMIVDELDQLIRTIEDDERFRCHYNSSVNIDDLYRNMAIYFALFSSSIVQLMATDHLRRNIKSNSNDEWLDYYLDDDEEEEEEEEDEETAKEDFEKQFGQNSSTWNRDHEEANTETGVPTTRSDLIQSQIYNLMLVIQNYLMEVCRQQMASAASTIPFG